jgi:hypothetical protein
MGRVRPKREKGSEKGSVLGQSRILHIPLFRVGVKMVAALTKLGSFGKK